MLARDCGRGEKAGGPVRSVTLTLVTPRHLPSEVWDVIARPERLARWYGPVSGELRVGGRFRVEGEAAGTILACEPGRRLEFAWEAAGESGWVDIALSHYGGGGARLILTHSVRETDRWRTFGPAGIGVGWDLASHALVGHLSRPGVDIDLRTVAALPESRRLLASCAESWGKARDRGGRGAGSRPGRGGGDGRPLRRRGSLGDCLNVRTGRPGAGVSRPSRAPGRRACPPNLPPGSRRPCAGSRPPHVRTVSDRKLRPPAPPAFFGLGASGAKAGFPGMAPRSSWPGP